VLKGERIQKILAHLGIGSRRQIEEWIKAGRISVNNQVATLGDRIDEMASIKLDGRAIRLKNVERTRLRVLLYHKPPGEVCSRHDPEGRPSVFDKLPPLRNQRWISIGRLDYNTAGLLLFTTDGELANRLMHPSGEIEREYAVRVLGKVDPTLLQKLLTGVVLEDGLAKFLEIIDAGGEGVNHWYHVLLKEGRNREVRRLWESQGVTVSRLIRVRFGSVSLPRTLRMGRTLELDKEQTTALCQLVNLQ
jgi:23S rRNA pseudouridine2605 synthase